MKKPPKIKPGKPKSKPSPEQLTIAINHKTPTTLPEAASATQPERERTKITLGKLWNKFWSFAGPILTLIAAAAYWLPSVTLATGVNLDPKQDFQTQFVVTNSGHLPIYDVTFACSLVGNQGSIGELQVGGNTLAPIPSLKPGEPASRGCFQKSLSINGPILKVDAYYRWPFIGRIATATAYFALRHGANGTALVPEATPASALPTLLRIGAPPPS
jgi:hypothetical protein